MPADEMLTLRTLVDPERAVQHHYTPISAIDPPPYIGQNALQTYESRSSSRYTMRDTSRDSSVDISRSPSPHQVPPISAPLLPEVERAAMPNNSRDTSPDQRISIRAPLLSEEERDAMPDIEPIESRPRKEFINSSLRIARAKTWHR